MDFSCKSRILSNDYYDFIIDFDIDPAEVTTTDYCTQRIMTRNFIAYVNRSEVLPLSIADYTYAIIPKLYTTVNMEENTDVEALQNSGILQMQDGLLNITGRGVMLGFVDTGINFRLNAFRYQDGSTKIETIWDQTIQTGMPPQGLNYGTEYSREMIDQTLRGENAVVESTDLNGHGTAMAEFAASAAPGAILGVVKLKEAKQYLRDFYAVGEAAEAYQENDIMLAVEYLHAYAKRKNLPLVICIGLGTNSGDHTGKSSLARLLNRLSLEENRGIIVAGGNEGNARHHFRGRAEYTPVEVRVGEGNRGFLLELWGQSPDLYAVSLRSPGGETVPRIPARLGTSETYQFLYEGTTVRVDYRLVEREAGEELVAMRFEKPAAGIWTIGVYSTNLYEGDFHLWLPITGLVQEDTYFLEPNPFVTLTEPANAINPITVSGYDDETGGIYINSGRGYTRIDQRKPDFAAPSVNISTSLGSYTGTSMAAAITAGAVADFMEWAVVRENLQTVDSTDIKQYFIRGAARDTGVTYPNRETGYGKLNLKGVFDSLVFVV